LGRIGAEVDMKLKIILEPSDEGGYTAIVPSLPGRISEGDSKEEALSSIKEALPVSHPTATNFLFPIMD
jgi:predicted RNase H-like HicB family nuclease